MACAFVIALLVLAGFGRGARHRRDDWDIYHQKIFTVVQVADGDTFNIGVPDGPHPDTRVRLWGVDTPEVANSRDGAKHFGAEASAFARSTLLGKTVRITLAPERSRDKYNRLLAYVELAETGQSYNEMLLTQGYAYADWRFDHPHKRTFKGLEREARKAGRGLWKEVTLEQMPEWRRRMEHELNHAPP